MFTIPEFGVCAKAAVHTASSVNPAQIRENSKGIKGSE
jgi:hypothetical protein